MRAVMVLLTLVATPLAMGVSQTGSGLPGKSSCVNGQGTATPPRGDHMGVRVELCVPQDHRAPAASPTSGCVASAPSMPGVSIGSQVFGHLPMARSDQLVRPADRYGHRRGYRCFGQLIFGVTVRTYTVCQARTGWQGPSRRRASAHRLRLVIHVGGGSAGFNNFWGVRPRGRPRLTKTAPCEAPLPAATGGGASAHILPSFYGPAPGVHRIRDRGMTRLAAERRHNLAQRFELPRPRRSQRKRQPRDSRRRQPVCHHLGASGCDALARRMPSGTA
jgi:hypothetical protein